MVFEKGTCTRARALSLSFSLPFSLVRDTVCVCVWGGFGLIFGDRIYPPPLLLATDSREPEPSPRRRKLFVFVLPTDLLQQILHLLLHHIIVSCFVHPVCFLGGRGILEARRRRRRFILNMQPHSYLDVDALSCLAPRQDIRNQMHVASPVSSSLPCASHFEF